MSITSPPIKGSQDLREQVKSLHNKKFNVKTIILENGKISETNLRESLKKIKTVCN